MLPEEQPPKQRLDVHLPPILPVPEVVLPVVAPKEGGRVLRKVQEVEGTARHGLLQIVVLLVPLQLGVVLEIGLKDLNHQK